MDNVIKVYEQDEVQTVNKGLSNDATLQDVIKAVNSLYEKVENLYRFENQRLQSEIEKIQFGMKYDEVIRHIKGV